VERPTYEQLVAEVAELGWSAVGRKYGVSDNAVRKWVKGYERERLDECFVADGVE
jgi:transposase-like protein